MPMIIDWTSLQLWFFKYTEWLYAKFFLWDNIAQITVIIASFFLAILGNSYFRRFIVAQSQNQNLVGSIRKLFETINLFSWAILWVLELGIATLIYKLINWPSQIIDVMALLIIYWILIRAIFSLVKNPLISKLLAMIVFIIVALNVIGWLDPTMQILEKLTFNLGNLKISILSFVKGIISLGCLLWFATVISEILQKRIQKLTTLAPTVQVLIGKLVKVVLVIFAFVFTLSYVGLDLTTLAVFSGAVGVGIGLGLQKLVSNLVSGFILLLDKSIKPGDIIEVGDSFGLISSLGARYVAIRTRRGKEILIPNEDLVTRPVINWSYTDKLLRVEVPFPVAGKSDLHQVIEQAIACAASCSRALRQPKPQCYVIGFGEKYVNLNLQFWINDPHNGVTNVRGEVMLALWDKFREHRISFPFDTGELPGDTAIKSST
ncbi:MAG: mechanosensitive ion channel [Alphaproteobacteria bacterium]|nr:mechanosensitive ion channel [Alphaproteobacteria bacterium]